MKYWYSWKYKNLTFLTLGLLVTFILYKQEAFHQFLLQLGGLGYIGAFIAGMLFVSIFTTSIGVLVLLILAEQLPFLPLGIVAGAGAITGDILIFKFVRDGLLAELKLFKDTLEDKVEDAIEEVEFIDEKVHSRKLKLLKKKLKLLLHTKYFGWFLPALGVAILTSPLPDEMGVGLIGISKLQTYQLFLMLLIVKPLSVFLVLAAALIVKP